MAFITLGRQWIKREASSAIGMTRTWQNVRGELSGGDGTSKKKNVLHSQWQINYGQMSMTAINEVDRRWSTLVVTEVDCSSVAAHVHWETIVVAISPDEIFPPASKLTSMLAWYMIQMQWHTLTLVVISLLKILATMCHMNWHFSFDYWTIR